MEQTRNEFKIECENLINSSKGMNTTNPLLLSKMDELISNKYSKIKKLLKQLEKETGEEIDDLKLYITIKKEL